MKLATAFDGTIQILRLEWTFLTFGFLMSGLVIIFTVNLARIVLISLAIFQWASLTNILHDLVFPAIIYGTVLVLWLSWVMAIKSKKVAE